jgi:HK97 family phage major capsid protein
VNRAETYLEGIREQRGDTAELLPDEARELRSLTRLYEDLAATARTYESELQRCGELPPGLARRAADGGSCDAMAFGRQWVHQVADKLTRAMSRDGEQRAVVSGTIDIPTLVETQVIPIARPARLIDLFPNRAPVAGNAFEYYQQTVRTNAATAVPDGGLKPTSTLTVTPHSDRCRVIAHLFEPTPNRLWIDHDELRSWLSDEMVQGVLDGLEAQIVNGDPTAGNAESMVGLLHTPGTTTVPFATDAVTTLRSALTALQVLGETPTGWALNPVDAQAIDLEKWGTAGGFLTEGYATGVTPGADPSSNNIFGADIKRVVSNSVPAGTAILGDFTKLRVYVRQDATLAVDASGDLFTKNLFVCRGEGRFGIGVLRPSAFAIIDLTAT